MLREKFFETRLLLKLILISSTLFACMDSSSALAKVVKEIATKSGYVNLDSLIDLENTPELKGNWYFYKNQLIDSEDFKKGFRPSEEFLRERYTTTPNDDPELVHTATYILRLRLKNPAVDISNLGISSDQANGSERILLVANRPDFKQFNLLQKGKPHLDGDQVKITFQRKHSKLIPMQLEDVNEYFLIVQHSAPNTLKGRNFVGIGTPLLIGTYENIFKNNALKRTEAATIFGMMLLLFVSNMILYLQRNEDTASPFISLFALAYAFRHGVTEGLWYDFLAADSVGFSLVFLFFYWNMNTVCMLFFAQFLRQSFKQHFSTRWLKILWAWQLIICGYPVLIDSQNTMAFLSLFFTLQIATLVYVSIGLAKTVKAKENGSVLSAVGFLLLIAGIINDALYGTGVVEDWFYFSNYSSVIFVVIQSSIVGSNFARAFRTAERLSRNLAKEVDRQTRNIKAVLAYIHQGIFTISANGAKIGKEHSRHLTEILETEDVSGKTVDEVLLAKSTLSNDVRSTVNSSLDFILGENELNWECNEHVFVKDITLITENKKEKYLKADWAPITNSTGDIEKVLVTLRDVTELKKLEEQAAEHARLIEIISEIIEIDPDRFNSFVKVSKNFMDENRRLIDASQEFDREIVKILFINMHTMKGVARTYHLKRLTEVIHDAEQYYQALQHGTAEWDRDRLDSELKHVQTIFDEYFEVWEEKLGRDTSGEQFEIDMDTLQKSIAVIHELDEKFQLNTEMTPIINELRSTFYNLYYKPASEIFSTIFEELHRLAKDLDKKVPEVDMQLPDIGLTVDGIEIIQNAFVHILRNTMDHGIERPEEREAQGKPAKGRIQLTGEIIASETCSITYSDDGRGLNIDRIRELAVQRGLIDENEKPSTRKLASLIFESGFSTSKSVSEISGRGVGMGAVKKYLEEAGGSIEVIPVDEPVNGFVHFEIKITGGMKIFHVYTDKEKDAVA